MEGFKFSILTAMVAFPFIFSILFLPFLIWQYRRYGTASLWHGLMIFSFVFYMVIMYCLVVLPLPTADYLQHLQARGRPWFNFNILRSFHKMQIRHVFDYGFWYFISNSLTTQMIFNVLMTIPFGVYLRIYFKRTFKQTLVSTLSLTLFFETTQLTALYGLYWRPYRLFDIEDIILNLIGGVIGYACSYLLRSALPSRDWIDSRAYRLSKKIISKQRLIIMIILDLIVAGISFVVMLILLKELNHIVNLHQIPLYNKIHLVWQWLKSEI